MASPSRGRRAPGHATQLLLRSSSAVCTRRVPPRAHAAGEDRAARRRRRRERHLAGRPSESRATYCLVSRDRPPGVEARPPTSPRGWFPVPIRAPVGPRALRPTCRHLPTPPPPAPRAPLRVLSAPPPPGAAALSSAQAPATFGQLWRRRLSPDGTERLRLPAPGCPRQHSLEEQPRDGL